MVTRRTLFLVVVVASLGVLTSSVAAESDRDYTDLRIGTTEKGYDVFYPVANGYSWNRMDMQSKIFFLKGLDNGEYLLFLKVVEANKQGSASRAVIDSLLTDKIDGFKLSEIAEQIDMFFRDSANRQIPVIEAYRYVAKRIKGANPREFEDLASSLRNNYYKSQGK
jgi:hypothetical protein